MHHNSIHQAASSSNQAASVCTWPVLIDINNEQKKHTLREQCGSMTVSLIPKKGQTIIYYYQRNSVTRYRKVVFQSIRNLAHRIDNL